MSDYKVGDRLRIVAGWAEGYPGVEDSPPCAVANSHYLKPGTVVEVVEILANYNAPYVVRPVNPGAHNWVDGDDMDSNYVHDTHLEVIYPEVQITGIHDVEAYLNG